MKKNSKKTFSQRAQDLVKKYSRSNFDKVEKQELDAALQKLQEEQELYKQVNKIGEYSDEAMAQKAMQQQQMMAQQGQMQPDSQVGQMPQFDGISGTSDMNKAYTSTFNNTQEDYNRLLGMPIEEFISYRKNMSDDDFSKFQQFDLTRPGTGKTISMQAPPWKPRIYNDINKTTGILASQVGNAKGYTAPSFNWQQYAGQKVPGDTYNIGGNNVKMTNPDAFNSKTAIDVSAKAQQPSISQDQQVGQTQSILPSVIAGGIGMLGNIALGAGVKEHKLNQSYSADQISLAKERERLAREATTARNIGMRNLRGAGSRDAYLAGAGNVSAGVNQQLGDALSKSYFNEETTNLAQREKAAQLNRQVEMMNYQAKINADNERKGYYAAAAGIPAQTMADIGKINYQNSALLSSGTDNYLAGVNGKANPWKSQQIYRKFKK